MKVAWGFLLLAISSALLVVGAELFAEHAGDAGRKLGVTALAVGLVLAGAEPEELMTAVFASLRQRPAIAAGDAVGANVTMLTLVLGLACLLRPLPFGGRVRMYAVGAGGAGVAASLAVAGGVTRIEGLGLVLLYGALLGLVWWRERQPPAFGEAAELDEEHGEAGRPAVALLIVLGGIALMAIGGRLAVAGAERVVSSLGLADHTVGLTFVALATTAELIALVWAAARRSVEDLALAGVLGSALYNSTATLGTAALIHPIPRGGLAPAAALAAVLPFGLAAASMRRDRLARPVGLGLLGVYAAFVVLALGRP